MKRKEFLPYNQPLIGDEEIQEEMDTLNSGWLSTGPKTMRFEEQIAEYTAAKHAIALNSCTAALHLSLASLGIGKGDEVITTPFTFAATGHMIIHVGAKPVFVDIKRDTYNINPEKIEEAGLVIESVRLSKLQDFMELVARKPKGGDEAT